MSLVILNFRFSKFITKEDFCFVIDIPEGQF